MTREEAIEVLENGDWWDDLSEYISKPVMQELQDALDMAISALREQEQRRWIPVTERLPDKPMKCLVYTKRGECYSYDIVYYSQDFYLQYANVTHWMPIPEPPMEGSK